MDLFPPDDPLILRGVVIHLALGCLTIRAHPLDPARWSLEIFFYSEAPHSLASPGVLVSF